MRGAYNKEAADELAIDFELLTGIDINSTSRETKIMYSRTLFYKILKDTSLFYFPKVKAASSNSVERISKDFEITSFASKKDYELIYIKLTSFNTL